MSRSNELRIAVGVGALVVAGLAYAPMAAAEPTSAGSSQTITRPGPIPVPSGFRVYDLRPFAGVHLVPQVYELRTVTEREDGVSQYEESGAGVDITLSSDVLFDKDQAEIRTEAADALEEIVEELDRRSPGMVTITGYTDDLGPTDGIRLSEQRAEAVRDQLVSALGRHTVTVEGKGEEDPAYPNDSEENRAKNRRVVIHWEPA